MSRKPLILVFRLPALIAAALLAACSPPASAPAPEGPSPGSPTGDAPAPTSPPPADAPASPPATAEEPALESMRLASTSGKIGVPVDLRYSFDGDVLHLAAVPRVAGANLRISVQHDEGLEFSEGTLQVQKADPAGVYRKQLAVTRFAAGPARIRVLVTMGVAGGSGHGFYSIPLDSVKQD